MFGCTRHSSWSERALSNLGLFGHASGGGQYPVGDDKIAPLADGVARQPYRLLVIVSGELRVGGNAGVKR